MQAKLSLLVSGFSPAQQASSAQQLSDWLVATQSVAGVTDMAGVLIIQIANSADGEVQRQSAQALIHMMQLSAEVVAGVVKSGGIAAFLSLLGSSDPATVKKGIAGLGEIAKELPAYRDLVLKATTVDEISSVLKLTDETNFVGGVIWLVIQLMSQDVKLEDARKTVAAMTRIVQFHSDADVRCVAMRLIGDWCNLAEDYLHAVVETGVVHVLVDNVTDANPETAQNALNVLRVVLERARPAALAIRCGVIRKLRRQLGSDIVGIRQCVCEILTLFFDHVQPMIEEGIIKTLADLMKRDPDETVRFKATFGVCLAALGTVNQVMYVAELDFIRPVSEYIKTFRSEHLLLMSVRALRNILSVGDRIASRGGARKTNPYVQTVIDTGLLPCIPMLTFHKNKLVADSATGILFFCGAKRSSARSRE